VKTPPPQNGTQPTPFHKVASAHRLHYKEQLTVLESLDSPKIESLPLTEQMCASKYAARDEHLRVPGIKIWCASVRQQDVYYSWVVQNG